MLIYTGYVSGPFLYNSLSKRSALRSESLQTTQLFASKYMLHLPTEEELRLELERERKMVEEIQAAENES